MWREQGVRTAKRTRQCQWKQRVGWISLRKLLPRLLVLRLASSLLLGRPALLLPLLLLLLLVLVVLVVLLPFLRRLHLLFFPQETGHLVQLLAPHRLTGNRSLRSWRYESREEGKHPVHLDNKALTHTDC